MTSLLGILSLLIMTVMVGLLITLAISAKESNDDFL